VNKDDGIIFLMLSSINLGLNERVGPTPKKVCLW